MRTFIITIALFAFARAEPTFIKTDHPLTQEVQYPENFTSLSSLQEFIRLVEENELNVSLIVSKTEQYNNGNPKEALALTITFPVNSASLTETKFSPEAYEALESAANKDGLTVAGTTATSGDLRIITNNPQGLPINKALKIFSGIKNGKTGFVFDEENFVAQYTFLPDGPEGETTRVLYGDVDVEVVDHSANLDDKKLDIIKKSIVDSYFTYDEDEVPRAIYVRLNKELSDFDWEVATQVGDHSYLDTNTWAQIKLLDENVLVYSI